MERKKTRERTRRVFGHHLVRINLVWVGGANRCTPPADSFKLQGEAEKLQLSL
jgi:hypothetical protein